MNSRTSVSSGSISISPEIVECPSVSSEIAGSTATGVSSATAASRFRRETSLRT
jgi:hypothetical protein